MPPVIDLPLCFYCKHRTEGRLKCKAFGEDLIPEDIILGKKEHLERDPRQVNEIVFESNCLFLEVSGGASRRR